MTKEYDTTNTNKRSDGFYAEIWDEDVNRPIKAFGPYASAGVAKGRATKIHKETGQYTAWAEIRGGKFTDGDLWPVTKSNGASEHDPNFVKEDDTIEPFIIENEDDGEFILVGSEKIRITTVEERQAINRYWLTKALLEPRFQADPQRLRKPRRRYRRRKVPNAPRKRRII